jgi:hypothetical protein
MAKYDINWLKEKGFFDKTIPLKIEDKEVVVDGNNLLAYVEVSNNEEVEKIRKGLSYSAQKIKYIWFYFPFEEKVKVFRRYGGELPWFWYKPELRKEFLKSREDKLNKFSVKNMDILFDTRDIAERFYWQLWEVRIKMAKSIQDLKEDGNKLLVVQHLLDRLIFFYFLAQLGLVRIKNKEIDWELDRKRTREFFKWICEALSEKELQDFLNKIFFDVLGEVREDGWSLEQFEIGNEKFSVAAPSLNGGLFVEDEFEGKSEREIRIKGIKELILEILNEYNWVIGDEVPEEEDVIGDLTPEIIGHIYEKFVVSLEQIGIGKIKLRDVQTVREELRYGRKKIGAYYTPEEITNYISMNTICPYIRDRLKYKFGNVGESLFNDLFKKENFSKEELAIVKYLYFEVLTKINICDNACGSGSFLIAAGDVLLRLYSRILKILEDNLSEDEDVEEVLINIRKSPSRNYYIVRQIIVNNLYGVDIMEGAIEIAKLRFWLWLISKVDPKKVEDKRIETLPNLDFNLMVGNSLIGFVDIEDVEFDFVLIKSKKIQKTFASKQYLITTWTDKEKVKWLKDLAKKKQEFKTLPAHEAIKLKEKLNKELEQARKFLDEKFLQLLKSKGIEISKEEFLKLKPFHWGFEFYEVFDLEKPKEERGFDIVIGNPPYGNILKDIEKDILSALNFKVIITDRTGNGTKNSAAIFIERSKKLLDKNGKFGYIVPKALLYIEEWEKTRKLLLEDVNLLRVVDCSKAFRDVKLEMCIIIYEHQNERLNDKIIVHNFYLYNLRKFSTRPYNIDRKFLTKERFITEIDEEKEKIVNSVIKKSVPLGEICEIWRGLSLNKYVSNNPSRKTKKILRGDDISRYSIVKFGFIDEKYLKNINFKPGNLIFQRIVAHIENPNPHIKLTGTLNNDFFLNVNTVTNISIRNEYKDFIDEKFLLALLNSKLISWFTYKYIYTNAIRSMDFVGTYAFSVPIINPNFQFIKGIRPTFRLIVDYMLFLNKTEERRESEKDIINFIDKQIIDSLVYELYFKEKFEQDGIKTNLLQLVEPHLKDIENLKSDEEKLKAIKQIAEKIKNDSKVMKEIEKIKSHPWVKIIEGNGNESKN